MADRASLVGTRLALPGAVLYLLEWVVIPFLPDVPTDPLGGDPAVIVDTYAGHANIVAFAAGWFAVVLIGRVLYVSALRDSIEASWDRSTLARFAVGAMVVSVTLEVASFGLVAAAGWLADQEEAAQAILALDAAGSIVFLLVFALVGVSTFSASSAMLGSGLFPKWVCWLGIVAGGLGIVGGAFEPMRVGGTGTILNAAEISTTIGGLMFWVWMLATSIILWRRAPRRRASTP